MSVSIILHLFILYQIFTIHITIKWKKQDAPSLSHNDVVYVSLDESLLFVNDTLSLLSFSVELLEILVPHIFRIKLYVNNILLKNILFFDDEGIILNIAARIR